VLRPLLLDGCFVALASTAEWFLWAPAGRPQQVADVIEVILHAELASDDLGDAPRCPHLATKAECFGTQCEQQRQSGKLLRGGPPSSLLKIARFDLLRLFR
jgi:hypothetical protein